MHVYKSWMTGHWCVNSCRLAGRRPRLGCTACGARGFPDAAVLLRTLLVHLAGWLFPQGDGHQRPTSRLV